MKKSNNIINNNENNASIICYKKYANYIAALLFTFGFLFYFIFTLYSPQEEEFYHKQSSTIVKICQSNDHLTKPISYNQKCIERETSQEVKKTPFNLTVAFISDQSPTLSTRKVLQLIKKEEAEVIIHQGGFGHSSSPSQWEEEINEILGPSFPVFAAMGNHDYYHWEEYYTMLESRLSRVMEREKGIVDCKGCLGVRSVCNYKGLWIYQTSDGVFNLRDNEIFLHNPSSPNSNFDQSSEGTTDRYYEIDILKQELDCAKKRGFQWKICSWHTYTFADFSTDTFGGKGVEENYKECIDAGALLVNSHPNTYSKFYPLSSLTSAYMGNFESNITKLINGKNIKIVATSSSPIISPGFTVQIISGLGGENAVDDNNNNNDVNNNDNNMKEKEKERGKKVDYGALICTINPPTISLLSDANGSLEEVVINYVDDISLNFASCKFIDIEENVIDRFVIYME